MRHINTTAMGSGRPAFKVLADAVSSQAALMILAPGESSSGQPEDEHPWAEQWVYVVAGTGRARGKGRSVALKAGSLLLVKKAEPHQITNTGRSPLVTVNVYAPPAYTKAGNLRRPPAPE